MGLLAGVELVADKGTKASFAPAQGVGAKMSDNAQKHGLIVRPLMDAIALCPPLIITTDGSAMVGYCDTGRLVMDKAPASMMTMATTHAKIGRSIKKRAMLNALAYLAATCAAGR